MKLKTSVQMMTMIPMLVIIVIAVFICRNGVDKSVQKAATEGIRATAITFRDSLDEMIVGDYYVDEDGCLCKGDTALSDNVALVDDVKTGSGVVLTLFYGDTRYLTSVTDASGNRSVGTKADATIASTVLGGNEYSGTTTLTDGNKYYCEYVPLYNGDGTVVGMLFAGVAMNNYSASKNSMIYLTTGLMIFMMLCVGGIVYVAMQSVVKNLSQGAYVLSKMAEGDLSHPVHKEVLARKDEIGSMCKCVERVRQDLKKTMEGIQGESDILLNASEEMQKQASSITDSMNQAGKAVEDIAAGAGNQAEETQNATESIVVMGNMIEDTVTEVDALNANAKSIKERGEEALKALDELRRTNAETKEAIDVIYEQTNTTNTSAQKIREATDIISHIAAETNLLSLNASIEAARAGEAGRGFAVVASQIQTLAEQSNASARTIESITSSLLEDSAKAVATMDEVRSVMDEQNSNVENTGEQVTRVLQDVEKSIQSISDVATRTDKINESRIQVVDIVQSLSAIAEENAAASEETSASVDMVENSVASLSDMAVKVDSASANIHEHIKYFKL